MTRDKLVEIILVIIVCLLLSFLIFIFLKPKDRLVEAREKQRMNQVVAIAKALFQCAYDNHGVFPENLNQLESEFYYLIGAGSDISGCKRREILGMINLGAGNCGEGKTLEPDYISKMPIELMGKWNQEKTGFYIKKTAENKIIIGACSSEQGIIELIK